MNINSASITAATRMVRGLFLTSLAASTQASMVPKLCMDAKTTTGEALFGWLGNLPSMAPFKNEVKKQALAQADWTLKTQEYAMAYEIEAIKIRRDQLGIYTPIFSAAGERAGNHKDYMLAQRLAAGFSEVDYTGKNFFDTSKLFVKGVKSTFDNKMTGALTQATYRTARKMIRNIKDPAGYPVVANPEFSLIVSPDLEGTARDVLKADRLANGGTNTEYNTATLEVWNYLSGAAWYLAVNNSVLKPMINLDEVPIELYSKTDYASSDAAFNRHVFEYQAYSVNVINFGLPQLIIGCTGV